MMPRGVFRSESTAVLAACGLLLVGGCRDFHGFGWREPLQACVFSEMTHLTDATPRRDDPLIWDAPGKAVRLFAAANETVSFQVVVDAGDRPVEGLRFSPSALSSATGAKIRGGDVQAFRGLPVRVTDYPPWYLRLVDAVPQPTSFYDALVPLGPSAAESLPLKVPAAQRLLLWIDVRVPRDAAGGYSGTVTVTSDSHADWPIRLSLHVYDFVLPDARAVAAVGGFDHDALYRAFVRDNGKPYVPGQLDRKHPKVREGLVVLRQLLRLAHDHRLDLFDKQMRPVLKRSAEGKVLPYWEDYDAIVRPYLDGSAFDDRVGSPAWPVPVDQHWPDPQQYGGVDSPRYTATVEGLALACHEHFQKDLDCLKQVFYWPWRGEPCQQGYDRLMLLGGLIRRADNQTPVLATLPPHPPNLTGWAAPQGFGELVGILAPPADFLDPGDLKGMKRPDRPLAGGWLAPGTPPYLPSLGVIATPADVRAIPWFAAKYDCSGLFLPEVLHWGGDPFSPSAGAETRLFYPGPPVGAKEVLPSIRLKRLRRGLQDIAYLSLLRQRRRDAIADAVIRTMARYAGLEAAGDNYLDPRLDGWVQDPKAWQMAHRLLAEEVQAAIHPGRPDERQLFAQRLAWLQFEERTRDVVVEQIRSRVVATPDGRKLRAHVLLELYNQYGREVDVQLHFGPMPDGWKPLTDKGVLVKVPATTRRVVELGAQGDVAPHGANAKLALPVLIQTDLGRSKQIVAPVPFLVASPVKPPPRIDGVLDDWTARAGNCAADFRLLGRRGQSGTGLAKRQTAAFVLFDDQNLYIALRCDEPNPDGIVAKANNMLQYQQLMACGEDLVEILLDPGARAKGPENLYHIAVKPNGVLVAERGVRTQPPLGRVEAWPVPAAVAVGREGKVWVVELSIPLASFGPAGKEKFWGVNFTRFAVQGAEASSWSEAPRYFYDPRNLGTMYVGGPEAP